MRGNGSTGRYEGWPKGVLGLSRAQIATTARGFSDAPDPVNDLDSSRTTSVHSAGESTTVQTSSSQGQLAASISGGPPLNYLS